MEDPAMGSSSSSSSSSSGQCQILLLGDLTFTFEEDLARLLHCKTNATLQTFFDQLNVAFRQDFAALPAQQRAWLPSFTRLVDLVANLKGSIGAPAVRFALLGAYQIGRFISADSYPDATNSYLVGVCAGSFAAAAISASRTTSELVPAGVEAVRAAFRTGLQSLKIQREIELGPGEPAGSWCFIAGVAEPEALEALRRFHAGARLPPCSRLYASAVTATTVTISGPPRVLKRFVDSVAIKGRHIPIHTPYHAAHLNGTETVDEVLGHLRDERLEQYRPRIPLLSPADGTLVTASTFSGLLRRAIEDALCEQVRWDKICPALSSLLAQRQCVECVVSPVGSNAAHLVCSALQKEERRKVTISNAGTTDEERSQAKPPSGNFQDSKIAIVGFSGRFPDAASNDELWEILKAGRDCHRTIPPDRFDWEAHYSTSGKKNCSRVKYGCFIDEPGLFDDRFFNISPREAENMDPAQRLALMATYEAFEMAGLVIDRTPSTQRDRIGVFFGTTSDDWREVNSGQDVGTHFIPGGNRAFIPGRISYFFRLSGPSISVDTACSSSFAAISTACSHLWQGDCDSAIAGGTNVLTNPDNFVGLDRGHFLSTTGNCNPFDNSASGYCRADAVGAVILKRLDDALADHDPIFGVIAGASTNHCGQTVSITRPHEGDQLSLFKRILRHTDTDPTDISYVEMHGTGTQAGDAAEMRSVLSAFAWDHRRTEETPRRPLHLGAIKANVGHAESASGVTALIKVLMMMKHNEIPPHRLDGELNHNYPADLSERNVHIAFQAKPWRREDCPGGVRRSFLNNFSAAGGNTAVLLEDAPLRKSSGPPDPRSFFPVTVSARTKNALKSNLGALISYLERNPHTSLPALSYTTTARRTHHKLRVLVSGANVADIKAGLQLRVNDLLEPIRSQPPKAVFVFTGQGTLYRGIGKQLFHQVATFRSQILGLDRIAQQHGFPSFVDIISGEGEGDGDAETLDPVVAQLAMTCVQMALSRLWVCWFGEPSSVIGHSLGEYAALYASGVLSASDTIYLVGNRALLISKHCSRGTHSMLAIKAPLSSVSPWLAKTACTVACINSPSSVVVSGRKSAVQQLSESLGSVNVPTVALEVPYAFHSAHVEPILAEFEALASTVQFHEPTIPYISPLLEKAVKGGGVFNASYLTKAARNVVNFQGAIEAARDTKMVDDRTVWIEIGAHPACAGMIKQTIGSQAITAPTLRHNVDVWKVLLDSIEILYRAGAEIQWDEFHRDFRVAHEVLPLPNYKWDLKNYWIQYRNNFCLTKGDAVSSAPPAVPAVLPSISSSVHRVLEEKRSAEALTLLVESDLHDPRLTPTLSGHRVNTAELCPSSMYADMALTISKYMLESNGLSNEKIGLDCSTMNIQSPLVLRHDLTSQLLRVSAELHWSKKEVFLSFFTVDSNKRKVADHSSCIVRITEEQNWLADWKRNAYLITSRISHLHKAVDTENAHKLKRGLIYKLFSSLVDYAPNYQGMEQVVFDSEDLEATAEVKFQADDQGFHCNPCWIDSLGHIAGFIMNGSDHVGSKDQVFINHGWSSMRLGKPLERGATYTTYNRMQLQSGTMYVGDTYIFEGQQLVAIFEGVKFQGVKRSVLDHLLPKTTTVRARSNAAPKVSSPVQPSSNARVAAPRRIALPAVPRVKVAQTPLRNQLRQSPGALKIIAEETQVAENEVDLDAEFTDLGIDSLLSLTILERLQTELEIEVSSSDFFEYPTVKAFLDFIEGKENLPSFSLESGATTPSTLDKYEGDSTDATSLDSNIPDAGADIMAIVRAVISENTGVPIEEISSDCSLVELGLDSLLALTITGILSEEIDTQLSSSLFLDNETLGDLERALHDTTSIRKHSQTEVAEKHGRTFNSKETTATNHSPSYGDVKELHESPHATSTLLQGSAKTARKRLFLFPDGAGSATSYHALPSISPDIAVHGLNCPWLKTPEHLQCSLEYYVTKMLIEIQRLQPSGPYYFGGASAGGILAYEAAQQLATRGETVLKLLLIDSPDPVGLENPNERMYDFLDSMGMFGMSKKQAPKWLRPHFNAFLTMLDAYNVEKYVGSSPPRTYIMYARDGMCKHESDPRPEMRPDDPREMLWLLNNRTDFSGAGWNSLLGKNHIDVTVLDDVNHYTILQPGPKIRELGEHMRRVLMMQ